MLGPNHLVITEATLGNPPFRTIIESAATGGFDCVSISPTRAYFPAKDAGLTPRVVNHQFDAMLSHG